MKENIVHEIIRKEEEFTEKYRYYPVAIFIPMNRTRELVEELSLSERNNLVLVNTFRGMKVIEISIKHEEVYVGIINELK